MSKINWNVAGWTVLVFLCVWFLNFNSALRAYNDRIDACEFSKTYRDRPNSQGWQAAEHARHSTYGDPNRNPADHEAVLQYHRIHTAIDKAINTPCTDRYTPPGVLG